jgi:hypothetical protein
MDHNQATEIQLTLTIGGSREGDDYRFIGDEPSLRRLATTILARLDRKQPLPWESDATTILCEEVSRQTRSLITGKKRTLAAFLSFQLKVGTDS